MVTKINYNTKAPFQTLEEIPNENKVNADDMNEIKQVVNANADELDTAKENIESLQGGQGTSNAEITNLKNRVGVLETDNSTNKTNIKNLQEKVSILENDNTTNKSNIETLQQDNETNKTNITNLQNNKVDKVEGKGLSTNDFDNTYKEKLDGLSNYDDTEIKEDISNLEAEQTEQDKQIDMLINALPSETQEGENINIKGTVPVKFKEFKVSGNSKQETTDTMPSPEYPSPIQNVEGDVNVTVSNKNLFTGLVKGISINHTTGEEGKSNKSSASDFIKVNFDTNSGYYLSGLTNTISSYVAFYNKDKKYLGRTGGFEQLFISFSANSFSSKAPDYETIEDKNITFVRITQYATAVSPGTIDDIDNLQIQLETGATATNYVEHQQQTVTFPLSEGQKLMKGDYLADDGIHHVRKQDTVTGTTKVFEDAKENGSYMCNIKEAGILNGKTITFNESVTNAIVEYELAEEEIEAYTEEQQEAYNQLKQLTAYEEETNIYSTNEVSPIFKVTAVKDINSVIEDTNAKIEAINELLSTTATSAMLLDNMQSDLESEVM